MRHERIGDAILHDVPKLCRKPDGLLPKLNVCAICSNAATHFEHKVRPMLGYGITLVRLVIRDVPFLSAAAIERIRLHIRARSVTVCGGIKDLRVRCTGLNHVRAIGYRTAVFFDLVFRCNCVLFYGTLASRCCLGIFFCRLSFYAIVRISDCHLLWFSRCRLRQRRRNVTRIVRLPARVLHAIGSSHF